MAKKGFIKDQNNIEMLPITRGELVLDSSGRQALHSNEFLATDSQPGLMSKEDKAKLDKLNENGATIDLVSATTDGLAPKIGTAAASAVTTQADEWVLTSTKGATPTWRKLPTNAFLNYYRPILVNGTSLLGNNNTALNIVAGNNINLTTDSGKVTINNTITKLSQLTDDILSGKYLPLTGGTLTGDLNIGSETTVNTSDRRLYLWKGDGTNSRRGLLILNNQGTSLSYWNVTTKHYSSLWINESGLYFTQDGSANPTLLKIWHERNDGSDSGLDADMLDGKHLNEIFYHKGWQSVSNLEDADNATIGLYKLGASELNIPKPYGHLISFIQNKSDGYGGMQFYSYNKQELYYRNHWESNYSAWRQIAFTDSNITGNAATADKLKNKVQLWGNDFDGSNNVNGDISLGGKKIYWHVDPEHYYIGTSYTISSQSTNLDYEAAAGHRFLSFNKELLRITTSGYVGVGTTDPKSKLDVNGSISNKDIINCYQDGTVNRLTMRMVDNVGMVYAFNESESGYKKLLIGRNDGTTITIAENGNVGIGTYYPQYKLDVNGVIQSKGIVIGNEINYSAKSTDGKDIGLMYLSSLNNLIIGKGVSDNKSSTYVHGNSIIFRSKGGVTDQTMSISNHGNVTIGNSNLAGTTYKLYVDGNTNINGSLTASTFLGNLDWSYITNKPTSFTPAAHDHTRIVNTDTSGRGIEGTLVPSKFEKGLTFNTIYGGTAKSWPVNYGNVVTIRGNGDNQIVISWNANQTETNTNVAQEMYIRSKRDSGAGDQWSDWTRVITDRNYSEYCAPKTHTHTSNQITTLTGYTKATSASDLVTTDTLNTALGKLEYKAGIAYSWYRTITEDDTDEIINKWDEVVDFVNNLEVDLTEEFVTRKTDQTIIGQKNFNTASNSVPLKISRAGSNTECLSIGINDTSVLFNLQQDETIASYIFTGTWTNTGDGGDGTKPGTAYVLFNLRDNDKNIYLNNGTTTYTVLHSGIAYINNGTITINGTSITPITSHQSLSNYVTLNTHQTITGSKQFSADIALNHNSTKSTSYSLRMYGTSDTYKYLYAKGNDLYFDGATFKGKIWRENNDGSGSGLDADLLDGKHASQFIGLYTRNDVGTTINFDNPHVNGFFEMRRSNEITSTGIKPFDNFAPILSLKSQHVMMQIAGTNTQGWWIRGIQKNNATLENVEWQQLARTTDNVATATKLQTPRKIWGNNFDGTADIDGSIISTQSEFRISSNTDTELIKASATGSHVNIAYGAVVKQYVSYLYGKSIHFKTDTTTDVKMVIANNGNVGIGTTNPNQKLSVIGNVYSQGYFQVRDSAIQGTSTGLFNSNYNDAWTYRINDADGTTVKDYKIPHYGYTIGWGRYTHTNGTDYTDIGSFISDYFGLKFHVGNAGTTFRFGYGSGDNLVWGTTLYGDGRLRLQQNICIDQSKSRYIALGGESTYTWIDSRDSSNNVKNSILMYDNKTSIRNLNPQSNGSYSLGESSFRWFNIYSKNGNFSDGVEIANTLRITATSGVKYILMGNQDSEGVNNPFVMQSANGALAFGNGNSWTGTGGTFTRICRFDSSGITATNFIKDGSSNSYVLLGGGGHKALSDFLLESELATQELSANLTTITKSLTVTADWMDTGIKYTDLPANGTYVVQVSVEANDGTGSMYYCYWSGIMSWYRGTTNDSETDEIILHRSGHGYGNTIYLRTIMTTGTDGRHLRLQIAANKNLGAAYTYTFKFKRII